tara:strand:- start:10471 stop:15027 length:4557 start_codon:yes stop_codon:yes gene_type:complete
MNNPNFQQNGMAPRAQAGLQHFIQHYRSQQQQNKIPPGWQQSVSPEERGQLGLQFFTQYRLLKTDVSEMEAMRASVNFETQNFMAAQSKDQYVNNIKQKLMMMTSARQQQLQRMQANMGQMGNMNGINAAQMGMMGQQGPQGPRQGTPQQFNPAFPNAQLRQPMQVSPVPMPQGQPAMGMNNGNPANLNQPQNPQQPNLQQAQQNRSETMVINQFAKKLMDTCKDEVRQKFQRDVQEWPEDKKQQLTAQGVNPLFFRFRQHAEVLYRRGVLNPQGANGNPMQHGGQNRMPNQLAVNQRPDQGFDFNAIANQQIEAMRANDAGATVVPASNNMNGTQMNGFPGQNQQQNAALAQRQAAEAAAFQNNMQRQHQQQVHQAQAQAQAQAHAQLEQQRQRQAAQQRNSNQLLQGLNGGLNPGGLNLPPTSQSPGPMSMLNRPMHPPGQPGPPTPQQQPQNHVPVMTPRAGQVNDPQQVSALLREAQQRANAVAHSNQPLTEHVRMSMMPADLDPQVKAQLLKVPEQQFRGILQNYMQSVRRNNGMVPFLGQVGQQQPNPLFNPPQPPQPGMPNPMMGANMANLGRPGLNMGQQQPAAGQQLTPGQRALQGNPQNQQNPAFQQQRLAAAHHMLRQNPGIIQATDDKPYPPNVLNVQVRQNLPPDVKTWRQLKQWAAQNPAIMPGVDLNKLLLLQVLHFQDIVKQQQGGVPGMQTPQPNMPGGAPPAQMAPNQGSMRTPQQQMNMQNMPAIQVTPQEMQTYRQKLQAQNTNVSDEQLRQYIMKQKLTVLQQQRAQQTQQHMLAQQAQQRAGQPQQQAAMTGQQQQPNRPPTAQSQAAQATPHTKAAARPHQAQTAQPTAANAKGTKRPNDDASDPTADGSTTNAAPQAPAMVPTRSAAGLNFTPEQMSKMTPAQQAQMKAQLLKAQDASNATGNKTQQQQRDLPNPEDIRTRMADPERMKAFAAMIADVEKSIPPRQPVQLPSQLRVPLQQALKDQLDKLKKTEQAMRVFHVSYDGASSDGFVRQVAKSRALVFQQINKQDGTLHDQVTLTAEEFKQHMRTMITFTAKIMTRMAQQQGQAPAQSVAQSSQAANTPPAQLNAANLKSLEQQQRQHKAPSAPTTDRPPFALGDQSARGAPTYFEGAKTVTNLVLPDKKRTKLDPVSQSSTPGAKASPRIGTGKGHSPELTRQPAPDKQIPQRPTFRCKLPDCEYSVRGFDSQTELDAHIGQMHVKIENPMQFALESMAEYLDVDQKTGEPKVDRNAVKRPAKAAPNANRASQPIKSEHTPGVPHNAATPAGPQAAATPMARVPTQTGLKSSPVTNFLKTPQTMAKVATPGSGAHAKATPTSMPRPAPKERQPVLPTEPEKEEEQQPLMPMSLLDYSYEDTFAALDANGPFTCLDLKDEDTTWALRSRPASPITTPDSSAKDTPSTRTSDISENDNLHINLDMDMPDAWAMGLSCDALPLDMRLSEDLQNLGVMLPPMDSDDMMLFPTYGDGMMDLDTLEKTMESMGGGLDPSVLGTV